MRMSLLLALVAWVLFVASVAARAAEAELTARWLTACEGTEAREYFAIRIFADGHVQYTGGEEAKEAGEKTTQIKAYDARYLGRRAADFIRAPASGRISITSTRPPVCMEFQTRVDGQMRVRRESIETRACKVFANDLARKLPLLSWVCPARATLTALCGQWPQGVPHARGER